MVMCKNTKKLWHSDAIFATSLHTFCEDTIILK